MHTAVAEPQPPSLLRMGLSPSLEGTLVARQLAWAGLQAVGTLVGVSILGGHPDLGFALALALGTLGVFPRALPRGLVVAAGVVAATLLAGVAGDGSSSLSVWASPALAAGWATRGLGSVQILAGGAAAGLGVAWLTGPTEPHRLLQLALGGAAAVGLGVWTSSVVVPGTLHPALHVLSQGAVTGIIASQVVLLGALRYHGVRRPPGPRRIKAKLQEQYRPPCLRAYRVDMDLSRNCPDVETRDGIGEVAAWIFGLQWTLQRLDREISTLDEADLLQRIESLQSEADVAADDFTADRKRATARHLERLVQHVRDLHDERARNAALSDYASAYLEEARAGLALAALQPGDHTPTGLEDVLARLRNHGVERDARRRTAREVAAVGT